MIDVPGAVDAAAADVSELPPFPDEEYEARLRAVRDRMRDLGLDALLVTAPENIYYLSGLNHQGYFVYHMLAVPAEGDLHLTTRAMERVTIEKQVTRAHFVGHTDSEDPARVTCDMLRSMGLERARLGLEKHSLCFPLRIGEGIQAGLPCARWSDASGIVDEIRLVKSPLELEYTRAAAAVSDAMMVAAIEVARPGVSEREVAAEIHRAMVLAGGEHAGFVPFIRPSPRLGQEHTTWLDRDLRAGEALFIEMAGCYHRYHAPLGRLFHLGAPPPGTGEIETVCLEAFDRVVAAIRPGVTAAEVYRAWQGRVDAAGLTHYRRHHCGYLVGLGFPPSWTGGSSVVGLRHDSDLVLRPGMVFHLLSWLMGTGRGDYFISNTALLGDERCEVLTKAPRHLAHAWPGVGARL